MIAIYSFADGGLRKTEFLEDGTLPENVVWIDLLEPTKQEEQLIEQAVGIEAPTREEMQEIEISSRLYREGESLYLTASILYHADTDQPENAAVTFIRSPRALVTLRYADPASFRVFPLRAARAPDLSSTPDVVLMGLLETITDRMADVLEHTGLEFDSLSKDVFRKRSIGTKGKQKNTDLEDVLIKLGRIEDLTSRCQDTLVSLYRLTSFYGALIAEMKGHKELKQRVKSISRDLQSLQDYAKSVAQKGGFLLDASLGLINIEQTAIIKIFSVAAMVFLPPTLIASIYGMNFEIMPELKWDYGYYGALVLMVLSAVLPYLYFKRRGWM